MMLTEMGARIERLEGENAQKDAEIERQAAEIEKLRAENAALLQGCDVPQAVLDRTARLERQMAGRDSQLREARAANSALAAENRGIGRRPPKAVEPAPDPLLKVTTMSTRRNHPPISGKRLTGLCACPRGHPLPAEPTGAVFRVVEDILDGRLVAIQYAVVRRHCRKCRRQVAPEIPGILPGGWFGAGLACLETVMRMHGIPYETIRRLINIIYHTDLAKSTVIPVDGVTGSLHPPYAHAEGMLFSEYIGDKTSRKSRHPVLAVGDGGRDLYRLPHGQGPGRGRPGDAAGRVRGPRHLRLPPCLEPHRQDPPKVPLPPCPRDRPHPGHVQDGSSSPTRNRIQARPDLNTPTHRQAATTPTCSRSSASAESATTMVPGAPCAPASPPGRCPAAARAMPAPTTTPSWQPSARPAGGAASTRTTSWSATCTAASATFRAPRRPHDARKRPSGWPRMPRAGPRHAGCLTHGRRLGRPSDGIRQSRFPAQPRQKRPASQVRSPDRPKPSSAGPPPPGKNPE